MTTSLIECASKFGTMPRSICVYCRRQTVKPDWRPFCSERCKLLDLRNWTDGRYSVPSDTNSSLSNQGGISNDVGADDTVLVSDD